MIVKNKSFSREVVYSTTSSGTSRQADKLRLNQISLHLKNIQACVETLDVQLQYNILCCIPQYFLPSYYDVYKWIDSNQYQK